MSDVKKNLSYPIVGTSMKRFFGPRGEIPQPERGDPFYGQDAQFTSSTPSYKDNGNGTRGVTCGREATA